MNLNINFLSVSFNSTNFQDFEKMLLKSLSLGNPIAVINNVRFHICDEHIEEGSESKKVSLYIFTYNTDILSNHSFNKSYLLSLLVLYII